MNIHLLRADIESIKVDAIVTAEKDHEQAANGRATVVTGGNLLARFVIHVPVPHADDDGADHHLRAAATMAIDRAEELAVAAVGLPALGRGGHGFSIERSARALLAAALDHAGRARSLQVVIFCVFGAEEHEIFKRVLEELRS